MPGGMEIIEASWFGGQYGMGMGGDCLAVRRQGVQQGGDTMAMRSQRLGNIDVGLFQPALRRGEQRMKYVQAGIPCMVVEKDGSCYIYRMRIRPAIIVLALACLPVMAQAAGNPQTASLSSAEQAYYDMVFSYTMEVNEAGKPYAWESYNAKGSILPGERFVSKSGYTCRNFTQTFVIGGQNGKDGGVACKRLGRDGWCRLNHGNALTCAMEDSGPLIGTPGIPAINAPSVSVGGGNMDFRSPSMPHTPNMPSNLEAPDSGEPTAQGYADTVTGTAGEAAGSVARNAGSWFNSLFR